MSNILDRAARMLADNRKLRRWCVAAAAFAVVLVATVSALLVGRANALAGGDTLRNAITDDSALYWEPADGTEANWQPVDPNTPVDSAAKLRLRIAFELPAGTLSNGATLQYRLPEGVSIDTSKGAVSGDVISAVTVADPTNANATKIGDYQIQDGVLTLNFNDDVALVNAGATADDASDANDSSAEVQLGSSLSAYVDLDLGFDNLTCNRDGLATMKLNDDVTIGVTKEAEKKAVDEDADVNAPTTGVGSSEAGVASARPRPLMAVAPSASLVATSGNGIDLMSYITSVQVQKMNDDGSYSKYPATEFTSGDKVKTTVNFALPGDKLSKDSHKVTYKLPDGLKPVGALTNREIKLDGKLLGYYSVDKDGNVTLDFNEDAYADGGYITGSFFFRGTVSNDSDDDSKQLNFGGDGGIITVKKKQESGGGEDTSHDIKVEKTATKSADDSKIYYTVTVSTEKGTPSTVDITDCLNKWNSSNATPAYEKGTLTLKEIFSKGGERTLGNSATWNDSGNNGPTFSLSGLPQLSAGDKYVLTYTVDTSRKSDGTDAVVDNQATATSDGKSDSSSQRLSFEQDAKKWGSYDPKTDHVIWTIEVNPNGKDVSNWTVSDNLPHDTKLTQQYVVRGSDGKEYGRFGSAGDSKVDFSFSKLSLTGAQKTQKYYIDIYTDAPSNDMDKLENKATTTTATGEVESSGTTTVKHRTTAVGKEHRTDAAADEKGEGVRKETWASNITLPGGTLSSFTYTDNIKDATDGNGLDRGPDSHYAIAAELEKAFKSSVSGTTVNSTGGLQLNVDDYNKYLYTGNGTAFYDDYYPQQDGIKKDVSFTVTYYDGPDCTGNVVDANDTTTHVKSFKVHVEIKDGATVKAVSMVTGEYPTYLDTTKVGEGASITAGNEGKVGDATSKPTFTYTRPHRILKAVKTGEHDYKDGNTTLDFGKIQDGKMTYRIALTTNPSDDGKNLVVTDTLPNGMTYVDGSATARFDEYYDSRAFSGDKAPQVTRTSTVDGTKLTITIPNYKYNSGSANVYLYYTVSIGSDPSWNNGSTEKTYKNTAEWGKSESTQTTKVERTYDKVSKSGEQLYENGEPTNNLRYYVEINAAGQDLDLNSDVLTLTDKFDSKSVDSDLDPSSIKLYAYDYSKEHHFDPNRPIENFKATYDAKTHTITVQVPDKRACVLTYEYTLDNTYGNGMVVENSANLNGKFSKSDSISLKEASGGADIHKGRLVLYKVDADDISRTLSGVKFELSYWDGAKWVNKTTAKPLVTDSQGSISYDYEKNQDGLQLNTLYRLAEVKGVEGYATDAEHFFIVKEVPTVGPPISDDAAFSKANAGNAMNKSGGTLTAADVDFFKNNKTNTMYVTNKYTRLTAKKAWTDENGVAKEAPAGAIAKLALFRYTKKVDSDNSVKVTVTAKGNQSWSSETKLTGNRVNNGTVAIKKGSDFAFNVGGLWGDCSFDVYVKGQKYGDTKTFASNAPVSVTISNITADTTIEVKQSVGNNVSLTEDSNNPWVEPPQILDDTNGVQVGDPVDVSSSNKWAANWDSLPKKVDGKDVYYAVKELNYTVNDKTYDAGTGAYDVSYINNDGIRTGTITVTNSEKKNQGYELPSTGGVPSLLPWVGGSLAVLAGALLAWRQFFRQGKD
jgi:uncharacterized repeat protein (TIGR01451 family)